MRKPRTANDLSIFCAEFALRKAPGGGVPEAPGVFRRRPSRRCAAKKGAPGRPGEAFVAKMSVSWWVFEGFRKKRRAAPGCTGEALVAKMSISWSVFEGFRKK